MDRLFTDETYIALLKAGTKFDLIFAPEGTPITRTQYENLDELNRILKCDRSAGEGDGVLEKISGEAENVTPPHLKRVIFEWLIQKTLFFLLILFFFRIHPRTWSGSRSLRRKLMHGNRKRLRQLKSLIP